jgi:hypothetical protein
MVIEGAFQSFSALQSAVRFIQAQHTTPDAQCAVRNIQGTFEEH